MSEDEKVTEATFERKCPDAGKCHHDCSAACWRVTHAGPLSGMFSNNQWPTEITMEAKLRELMAQNRQEVFEVEGRVLSDYQRGVVDAVRDLTSALKAIVDA
jgi:hypothetical protein